MKKAKFKGSCWLWPYAINKDGYGQIQKENKRFDAHKWLYEIIKGKVPYKSELDHLCHNRNCINPEHLEPVSHAENCRRGNQTKLTPNDIKKIKSLSATKSHLEISKMFNVSRQSISMILSGKRWV